MKISENKYKTVLFEIDPFVIDPFEIDPFMIDPFMIFRFLDLLIKIKQRI